MPEVHRLSEATGNRLGGVGDEAGAYYAEVGRPGWPPTMLLRMLILEQEADLSDREVDQHQLLPALSRIVRLGAEASMPDDTTLVRFRARIDEPGSERSSTR
jgi:hypothetical protein